MVDEGKGLSSSPVRLAPPAQAIAIAENADSEAFSTERWYPTQPHLFFIDFFPGTTGRREGRRLAGWDREFSLSRLDDDGWEIRRETVRKQVGKLAGKQGTRFVAFIKTAQLFSGADFFW